MNKIVKQIVESFKGLLPEDKIGTVEEAINEFVQQVEQKYKTDYEKTLEASYKDWDVQLKQLKEEGEGKLTESEKVALEGYEQAKQMLEQKEQELIVQKEEFENFMEEQYAVAKEMISTEKGKNEQIEQDLYEAYTAQINDIKEDLVNKMDDFIETKIEEIAETVRKEMRNSPDVLESKVAFEKIKSIVGESFKSENFSSSEKVNDLKTQVAQLEGELKAIKAKNFRLTTENQKYEKAKVIQESADENDTEMDKVRKETERRIAERIAENAEGRGKVVDVADIIPEKAAGEKKVETANIQESIGDLGYSQADLKKMIGLTK